MGKNLVNNILTQDRLDPSTGKASHSNRFNTGDRRDSPHIVLNIGEEKDTLVKSLFMSDATRKEVWRKLADSYQKGNIQSKLIPFTRHNVSYKDGDILQHHLNIFKEIFL